MTSTPDGPVGDRDMETVDELPSVGGRDSGDVAGVGTVAADGDTSSTDSVYTEEDGAGGPSGDPARDSDGIEQGEAP